MSQQFTILYAILLFVWIYCVLFSVASVYQVSLMKHELGQNIKKNNRVWHELHVFADRTFQSYCMNRPFTFSLQPGMQNKRTESYWSYRKAQVGGLPPHPVHLLFSLQLYHLHYSLRMRRLIKGICSKTFISTVICLQNGHSTKNFAPFAACENE